MGDALHGLCQPLTALQCRLFLATWPQTAAEALSPAARAQELEQAITEALKQCERAIEQVRAIRERVEESEGVTI